MVIAADSAGIAGAIEPSARSLRGLDAVNLFLAGALSGFGPYVAAFLAEQKWTQQDIGFVLTAAGLAGLLSQLPGGAMLDAIRSKRIAVALGAAMVAAGALIIAIWPAAGFSDHRLIERLALPIRREPCGQAGSRKSRWSRLSGRRIASRYL